MLKKKYLFIKFKQNSPDIREKKQFFIRPAFMIIIIVGKIIKISSAIVFEF